MSNEDFYAEFGNELLVLNGLDYSVNNHSPGARYMATGKLDSLAYPTFAALVAACQGPACPLSFLTFGNYSATGNLVAMSRVPVPAVAASASPMPTPSRATSARRITTTSPSTASSRRCASRHEAARRAAAAAARGARREHALRGPGELEGAAARHAVHSRRHPEGAPRRSRPRSRSPRSRPASASPRT